MPKLTNEGLRETMKLEYIQRKKVSLQELADEFNVHMSTVGRWSKADKWVEERQIYWNTIDEIAIEKLQAQRVKELTDINEEDAFVWKQFMEKIKRLILQTDKTLELKHLSEIFERAQKGRRLAKGLDKVDAINTEQVKQAIEQFKQTVQMDPEDVSTLFEEEDGEQPNENNGSTV